MLNRKDLLGGVVLGAALSCVLYVGAMTTPTHAMSAQKNLGQNTVDPKVGAQQVVAAARASDVRNTAASK
jgi:hypothetical protein